MRLAGGDEARAAALSAAAEKSYSDAREYDAAYVLVHFFAYLGRDPDQSGYDFWLDVLTRTGDRRALSRAFMESDEYRNYSEREASRGDELNRDGQDGQDKKDR